MKINIEGDQTKMGIKVGYYLWNFRPTIFQLKFFWSLGHFKGSNMCGKLFEIFTFVNYGVIGNETLTLENPSL